MTQQACSGYDTSVWIKSYNLEITQPVGLGQILHYWNGMRNEMEKKELT